MSKDSRISNEEVLRIAGLAHLDLQPPDAERMARDLGQILSYVDLLREVDVAGVPPTSHVDEAPVALRPDAEIPGLSHDLALREAPSADEGGFRVPAFVDEG